MQFITLSIIDLHHQISKSFHIVVNKSDSEHLQDMRFATVSVKPFSTRN